MRRIPVYSLAIGVLAVFGCATSPEAAPQAPPPLAFTVPGALAASAPLPVDIPTVRFCDTREVQVEVADTPEARRQGLSGREKLATNSGMVLWWDEPMPVRIWMPDMRFSIDVVFVKDGKVHALYEDVPPCPEEGPCVSFGPPEPVDWVLELPAGGVKRWQVKLGDPIALFR